MPSGLGFEKSALSRRLENMTPSARASRQHLIKRNHNDDLQRLSFHLGVLLEPLLAQEAGLRTTAQKAWRGGPAPEPKANLRVVVLKPD